MSLSLLKGFLFFTAVTILLLLRFISYLLSPYLKQIQALQGSARQFVLLYLQRYDSLKGHL